ncbi:MAG: adaptor protein MecA [Lachnospiraceae bacterium]|nr:adaptor protein MecA [Lachnospiraceae bacterium]
MKIERLNDRQIRCTLTREDLDKRGLRLSEFAYGTKKARALFQDMMEQARYEVGFDAENYPLMIEAVPMGAECLVLVVTAVEDPEELDTRFSAFGPIMDEEDEDDGDDYEGEDNEEDNTFYRMLRGMQEGDFSGISEQFAARLNPSSVRQATGKQPPAKNKPGRKTPGVRIFCFSSIHEVRRAASMTMGQTNGILNTLYRDPSNRRFFLCLEQPVRQDNTDEAPQASREDASEKDAQVTRTAQVGNNVRIVVTVTTKDAADAPDPQADSAAKADAATVPDPVSDSAPEQKNKPNHAHRTPATSFPALCAILAEYGSAAAAGSISEEYLEEHCEALMRGDALQKLAAL